MDIKYALANTYAIKLNNSNKKTDISKDDLILNKYNKSNDQMFLFRDGSFLVGEKGHYEPILPNIPMDIDIKKEDFDNHSMHITYSRNGSDDFREDELSKRYLIIYEDGSGITMTGDSFINNKEELNELEMKKMTNQIGISLTLVKSSLSFLNKQGTELKNILSDKRKKKKKIKKSKDKKNHP